jgi:hypothetical protein
MLVTLVAVREMSTQTMVKARRTAAWTSPEAVFHSATVCFCPIADELWQRGVGVFRLASWMERNSSHSGHVTGSKSGPPFRCLANQCQRNDWMLSRLGPGTVMTRTDAIMTRGGLFYYENSVSNGAYGRQRMTLYCWSVLKMP